MHEKTINLLGIRQRAILHHFDGSKGKEVVIMKAISEEEEIEIDNSDAGGGVKFYHDDFTQRIIPATDIYMYGEIDFNNKEDKDLIKSYNLVDDHLMSSWVYSDFDYEHGTFTTKDGKVKAAPTSDPVKWMKYNHVLIGKPKRIIAYKVKAHYM